MKLVVPIADIPPKLTNLPGKKVKYLQLLLEFLVCALILYLHIIFHYDKQLYSLFCL